MLGEGSTFHFTIASNMRIARQHQASHDMQEELHQKRILEVQRSFAGKIAVVLVKVRVYEKKESGYDSKKSYIMNFSTWRVSGF